MWAFEQLPGAADEILPLLQRISCDNDWSARLVAIDDALAVYRRVIVERALLPEANLYADDLCDELIWARNNHAWKNTDWRAMMLDAQAKAIAKGYDPRIWQLLAHYRLLDDDAEPLHPADADTPRG